MPKVLDAVRLHVQTVLGEKEVLNLFAKYFSSVFSTKECDIADCFDIGPLFLGSLVLTQTVVERERSSLAIGLDPGPNGIPVVLLKRLASFSAKPLTFFE